MELSIRVKVLERSLQDQSLSEKYTDRFVETIRFVPVSKIVKRNPNDEVKNLYRQLFIKDKNILFLVQNW
jgi:hypothetical protein